MHATEEKTMASVQKSAMCRAMTPIDAFVAKLI